MKIKISHYTWGLANRFLQQVLHFLNTIILARFISPDDFGKVGILAVFTTLGATIADTGMGGSIVKEKQLTKIDCSTVFVYNLSFSVLFYIVIFFTAPSIENYFQVPELSLIARLICLPIIINAITIVPRNLCIKQLRFDQIFFVSLTAAIFSMCTAIVLAYLGYGVWSLVLYYITTAVIENFGFHIVCKYIPSFSFSWQSFKKLFSFGLFTTLSTVVDTIYENLLPLLFGRGLGAVEVGFYSQAKKLEETPSKSVSSAVSSVAFPVLVKINGTPQEFVLQAQKIQNALMSFSVPIMVLISVFSNEIILLLLGNSWIGASYYLSILCIAGVFSILENTNRTFIKSLGRSDIMFWISIIKRGVGLGIILISLAFWGIKVLLWSYVFSSFIGAFVNAIAISKISQFSLYCQMKSWAKLFIPIIILYPFLYLINVNCELSWPLIIFISLLVLLFYLIIISYLGIDEIYQMSKRKIRIK